MADLGGNPVHKLGVAHENLEVNKFRKVEEEFRGKENGDVAVVKSIIEMDNDGDVEEQLGKVSFDGQSLENGDNGDVDNTDKDAIIEGVSETASDEDESDSDSDSESESSTSSSSSSSSDDDEEGEEEEVSGEKKAKNEKGTIKGDIDIEEGEIRLSDGDDEMVEWSDNEDEEGGGDMKGLINSKNELKVIPPVPSVTVTLESHHLTQAVGIILSIIGAQIIVEGIEKHNPLSEGSILWITESRSSLGIVDEIFGPVKNPYYIVRYNSESEVPTGIQQGSLISFVPEFSSHVLNEKSLYQKGYDASGENDEEISDDLEFSDDEKEAEYKRMLKMKKRVTNESLSGTKRNEKRRLKNQSDNWNRNQDPCLVPPVETSLNQNNCSFSSGLGQGLASNNQALVPPFPFREPIPGFLTPNGTWSNGFPRGLPSNAIPWMQPHQLFQTPLPNSAVAQQQISAVPGLLGNCNFFNGPQNLGPGTPFAPWHACSDPNMFSQLQFGTNAGGGEQAVQTHRTQISQNFKPSHVNPGGPFNFNRGRGSGRRGHYRGGGGGGGRSRN